MPCTNQLCLLGSSIGQHNLDSLTAIDNVIIGDDIALRVDDNT